MKYRFLYIWPCFLVLLILGVGVATWAWSDNYDLMGPVQISGEGAATAVLSEIGKEIRVYNNQGQKIWTYVAEKTMGRIAVSNNGKYIAAAGSGVKLFYVPDKKMLWNWDKDGRSAIAITPDGAWIAAGGYTGKVYLFKRDSSQPVKTWSLDPKDDWPFSVALSDDGQTVAAASSLGVYVFDAGSGSMKWMARPSDRVKELKMSSDGRYILGIGAWSVYFWDKSDSLPVWQKKYTSSLIGAAMTAAGDKVVVSFNKGVSVMNNQGKQIRYFKDEFGNSDVSMSTNGRYIYVNNGSRRLYAFDDSYSASEMRPFRIVKDVNAGGHRASIITNASGNFYTYPKGDLLFVEESKPAVLVLSPGIPVLIKEQTLSMGAFITNPGITNQKMTLSVDFSLPASLDFWKKLTGKISDREPESIRSKLLQYTLGQLETSKNFHEEDLTVKAGSSQTRTFSGTVPDLASGSSFNDYLAGIMGNVSPTALLSKVLGKIKGPIAKLIGDSAADLAIISASKAISTASGEMIYPVMGMGTVTLYDAGGKALDQDSFYFMYLR